MIDVDKGQTVISAFHDDMELRGQFCASLFEWAEYWPYKGTVDRAQEIGFAAFHMILQEGE